MLENPLFRSSIRQLLQRELDVDRVWDDVTVEALGSHGMVPGRAEVFSRAPGVFCGTEVIEAFRECLPPGATCEIEVRDAQALAAGTRILSLEASAGTCLRVERTLLNFLGHLCGIATLTRRFVEAVRGYPTRILATRKTLPGLRELQLYAVRAGGGYVHRRNLGDGVMFKENHQIFLGAPEALRRARTERSPLHRTEVEVQDLAALHALLADPPDVVMLDNMDLETMREAVELVRGKCAIEVSGGITLDRVPAIAALGVDYVSVGQLTHSVPQLNLSLDIAPIAKPRAKGGE